MPFHALAKLQNNNREALSKAPASQLYMQYLPISRLSHGEVHDSQKQNSIFKPFSGDTFIQMAFGCFTFSVAPVNAGSGVSFTLICHSSWVSLSWADTTNSVGSAESWKLLSAYTTPSSSILKSSGSLLPKCIFLFPSQLWNLTVKHTYKMKNKKNEKAAHLNCVWYKMNIKLRTNIQKLKKVTNCYYNMANM